MASGCDVVLSRGMKQRVTNAYRRYKESVIHINYENNTATLTTNGKEEGVLIFGEMGDLICKLADGAPECTFQCFFNKVKEM